MEGIPLWTDRSSWALGTEQVVLLPDPARGTLERISFPCRPDKRCADATPTSSAEYPGRLSQIVLQGTRGVDEMLSAELRNPNRRSPFIPEGDDPQGPWGIWPYQGGYLQEYKVPWRILFLDADLETYSRSFWPQPVLEADGVEYSVRWFSWDTVPLPWGSFLAIGDVAENWDADSENNVYYTTYYQFDFDNNLTVLTDKGDTDKRMELGPARNQHSTLSHMPLLAANGEAGFAMHLGETLAIGRLDRGASRLAWLEDLPKVLPVLPRLVRTEGMPGHEQALVFLQELEAQSYVTGIYAQADDLYALVRKPLGRGPAAIWILVSLDPDTGAELYRKRLPSSAAHLDIIVGDPYWGLLERAPVRPILREAAPYMEVESLTLVPSSWLSSRVTTTALRPCKNLADAAPF